MRKRKLLFIRYLILILFALGLYYVTLPALNLHNPGFYAYMLMILMCFIVTSGISLFDGGSVITKVKGLPKASLILFGTVGGIFILIILINFICSPVFNSKSWSRRMSLL